MKVLIYLRDKYIKIRHFGEHYMWSFSFSKPGLMIFTPLMLSKLLFINNIVIKYWWVQKTKYVDKYMHTKKCRRMEECIVSPMGGNP